jgi:hypothetical protein
MISVAILGGMKLFVENETKIVNRGLNRKIVRFFIGLIIASSLNLYF